MVRRHLQKEKHKLVLSLERLRDSFVQDCETQITTKQQDCEARKFSESFARPMVFERPFTISWITDLNTNHPKETRPKVSLTHRKREKKSQQTDVRLTSIVKTVGIFVDFDLICGVENT